MKRVAFAPVSGFVVLVLALALALVAAGCSSDAPTLREPKDDSSGPTAVTSVQRTTTTTTPLPSPGHGATTATYTKALEYRFTHDAAARTTLSAAQATCAAPKWVDEIGVAALQRVGVEPIELEDPTVPFSELKLSRATADALVTAFSTCGYDVAAAYRNAIVAKLDATQRACLDAKLTAEQLHGIVVALLLPSGDPSVAENGRQLAQIAQDCHFDAG